VASVLKIAGVEVDRPAARIVLDRLVLQVDSGFDSLEFSEVCTTLPGAFGPRASCELIVDGVTCFKGAIVGSYPSSIGRGPIQIGYKAMGLEWLANRVAVTAADGTGRLAYNLPPTDDDYVPIDAGLSVGAILTRLFDLHAAELAAIGVASYAPADLAALVVVPPEPVYLTGGLWNAVRALLRKWCNKYVAWIDPADGSIKIKSQLTDLTPLTLTLDSDPIVVDRLSRDHSECFTRVVYRGGADVQAAYLDFADSGLSKGWSSGDESTYQESDFTQPKDAADLGDVTAMTSTTLTVQSDDAARTWAANYWPGVVAEVCAYNPVATGLTFCESRRITACTALSAGGTSALTVDVPFNNSGYTRYSIRGMYSPKSLVWRKLLINNAYVARHLVERFSHAVPWAPADGQVVMTTTPQAVICWSTGCNKPYNEFPLTFDVVPYDGTTDGYIVFHAPINKPWGAAPCEVKVLVPYSRGALSATVPSSGYEGTAHSEDGVEQALVVDDPSWLDYRDATARTQLAQEILDTVKNTVCEGSITYYGKLTPALTKGAAIGLARAGGTTGYESMAALARSVVLDWAPLSGGGSEWITRVAFSNRLKAFSGDRLYSHPSWGSHGALEGASLRTPGPTAAAAPRPDEGDDVRAAAAMLDADWSTPGGDASGRYEAGREYRKDRPYRTTNRPYRSDRKYASVSEDDRAADRAKARAGRDAESEGRRKLAASRPDRVISEDRRKAIRAGSLEHAQGLAGALGKDWARNMAEADGRADSRDRAEKSSARDASRLSHALGNPTGPGPRETPTTPGAIAAEEQRQKDRAIDAELARIAGEGDDAPRRPGVGGPGLGYQ